MKSHSDKNTKQPKLRFPGFTGEWVEKRLGDVGKITTGSTPSTFVEEYYNGQYLFVSPFDISDKKYIFTTQKTLTEEGFKKTRNIKKGSVLFVCIGSTIGKIAVAGTDLATNQQINAITCEDAAQNEFVYYSLLKKADQIKLMAGEQAVPIINKSNFETVKLPMTTPAEQKKIAEFLSDIDTKIEKLTNKKELTEQYKKGAMQKIFSQNIRFKDENGKNYPDWEEKRLGDVAEFRRGSFPQPYGLPEWYDEDNGTPFVQVFDVDTNMRLKEETKQKISNKAMPQSVFVEKGTIVLTIQGSIGRIALTQYDSYVDRTLLIFQSYKIPIDKVFFMHVVFLLFEIEKTKAPGGTIKTITKEKLKEFKVILPCLREQKKIADFFVDFDSRIEHIGKELVALKEFKKGLMQGMFI